MRGIIRFAVFTFLLLGSSLPAVSQGDFDPFIRCFISAEAPFLRAEGLAERIGEIRLDCTGGDPNEVKFFNLFVLVNAPITSDVVDPDTGETEALMLIDDPLPGEENRGNEVIFQGQVKGLPGVNPGPIDWGGAEDSGNVYPGFEAPAGINRIEWNGIPFRPAPRGQSRVLRIVNVRVDATQVPSNPLEPKTVSASLGVTMPNSIPIANNRVVTGFAQPSLTVDYRLEGSDFELLIEELYPEAFRKRIANDIGGVDDVRQQGLVENPFFTESGFTPDYAGLGLGAPGVADTGTRFVARFGDLPAGVYVTAPSSVISEKRTGEDTELELRRVIEFNEDFSGGVLLSNDSPTQFVPVVDGVAIVLYEVVAREPFRDMTGKDLLDLFRLPVRLIFAQPTNIGVPSVVVSYAPIDNTRTMSGPAPEPRFFSEAGGFLFPVEGGATRDYLTLRHTPTQEIPVTRTYRMPSGEAVSESIMVVDGGGWLTVTPEDEGTTRDILVAANPVGLATGRHFGAFTLRIDGDPNSLVIVPVLLDVSPPPELVLDTEPITFRATVGSTTPASRNLLVNARNKALNFQVEPSTASGMGWLTVTPSSGSTPANVRITADPSGLIPGRYEGAISVRAQDASNSPRIVPVVLEVVPPLPLFTAASIGNAASFEADGVSPGEIITIFGSNVGPDEPSGIRFDQSGRVATETGGTRILFDGTPGPMILASKTQSSCVVPYNVRGKATVQIQIEVDGWLSEAVAVAVRETKPGVFTADSSGSGQGAIVNQDGTLNIPSNPAAIGSVVTVYLTGVGETQPAGIDGAINIGPTLPAPLAPALVRIGGVETGIEFLAGAPGLVAGAIQANVRVPATPGEMVPVQFLIGGRTANIVYMSIE